MEKITTLKDLLIEQLRELYNAEKQQKEALLEFEIKSTFTDLKNIIHTHLNETYVHIERLQEIFNELGIAPFGEKSSAMYGLVQESYELVRRGTDPEILDASIIAAIQYLEHFEIAGYGTVNTYAKELGLERTAKLLDLTLEEEKKTDKALSKIAVRQINKKAITPLV